MKPYLFLSGLLLGTSISMSSLMADTHVVSASCNDARFGACTSLDIKHDEPTGKIPRLLGRGVGITMDMPARGARIIAGSIVYIPVCVGVGVLTLGRNSEFCGDALWNAVTGNF